MTWLEEQRQQLDDTMQLFAMKICERLPENHAAHAAFNAWVEPFMAWKHEEARARFSELKPFIR